MSRRGLTREIVVETAARLADAHGLDALTLALLAQELGVRSPSLYKHVEGLDALRQHLAQEAYRGLVREVGRAVMGRAGADAVLALAHAYRGYLHRHPGLSQVLERAPREHEAALQEQAGELLEICLAALQGLTPERTDALHAVRALRAMVHGFCALERAAGFALGLPVDESFERMLRAYLDGLGARG